MVFNKKICLTSEKMSLTGFPYFWLERTIDSDRKNDLILCWLLLHAAYLRWHEFQWAIVWLTRRTITILSRLQNRRSDETQPLEFALGISADCSLILISRLLTLIARTSDFQIKQVYPIRWITVRAFRRIVSCAAQMVNSPFLSAFLSTRRTVSCLRVRIPTLAPAALVRCKLDAAIRN